MSIKHVYGNILTPNNTEQKVIVCQQVNLQGVMGAGLAKQIKNEFPQCFKIYRKKCNDKTLKLGDILFYDSDEVHNFKIANIAGQDRYGSRGCYTDYDALEKAFHELKNNFSDYVIRIPYKIGCGLAGGDWDKVYGMINTIFEDVTVEIWQF